MTVEKISYQAGGKTFVGALVHDDRTSGKRPLMLMAPNWLGVTDEAIERTRMMTGERYIGFVADMYGDGKVSAGPPEPQPISRSLVSRDKPARPAKRSNSSAVSQLFWPMSRPYTSRRISSRTSALK